MRALLTPLHARHTGIFLRPRPFGRENAAGVEEPTAIGACSAPPVQLASRTHGQRGCHDRSSE